MSQVGSGEDVDIVLTKLAVPEDVTSMLPADGSSPGKPSRE